ncbi:MAG: tripartite tricarboxylate transporter substrate binding protein [Clostridia bacterium]
MFSKVKKVVSLLLVMLMVLATVGTAAFAEGAINSTVRIIVPFAAGGTSDILARILSPHLAKALGQDVIVENKPGAGGNLGADVVAHANADGTTLLLMDVGTLAISPSLYELTYDPRKDLTPVSMLAFTPYILAVNPNLPVKSVEELITYAKANPGKVKVAHSGVGAGNHLTDVVLNQELGLDWKIVAYKGGSDAIRAVVSNECDAILNGAAATKPYVAQGQLVGIALTGGQRLPDMADVPTFAELKLPEAEGGSWQGLLTTAGTPKEVVDQINAALAEIVQIPEIRDQIINLGAEIKTGPAEELGTWIETNVARWAEVIKANDIVVKK